MTNPRVVLVEDDESLGRAMERVLRLGGFDPRVFGSAEQLLESGAGADASCIVLDVQLPGIDGFTLHDRLRAAGNRTPVIFATAYDDREARTLAAQRMPCAFMAKPFTGRALLEAVRGALEPAREPPAVAT